MNETEKAAEILKSGGVVIFPTDTAFGVGCRIDNLNSVKRLFEIRNRPPTQATPVLVDSIEMAKNYLKNIPDDIKKLMERYWPGALTIIFLCKTEKVPGLVRGGGKTLGVRIPNHEITLELIKKVGVPILGPSANFHGEKTPFKFKDLDSSFVKKADFVMHGETSEGNISTVVDCTTKPWKTIREGAVKINL